MFLRPFILNNIIQEPPLEDGSCKEGYRQINCALKNNYLREFPILLAHNLVDAPFLSLTKRPRHPYQRLHCYLLFLRSSSSLSKLAVETPRTQIPTPQQRLYTPPCIFTSPVFKPGDTLTLLMTTRALALASATADTQELLYMQALNKSRASYIDLS